MDGLGENQQRGSYVGWEAKSPRGSAWHDLAPARAEPSSAAVVPRPSIIWTHIGMAPFIALLLVGSWNPRFVLMLVLLLTGGGMALVTVRLLIRVPCRAAIGYWCRPRSILNSNANESSSKRRSPLR